MRVRVRVCVVTFEFAQLSVGFVVYDWDGPLVGDDILGAAKVNMEPVK